MKSLQEKLNDAGYDNTFALIGCDDAFIGVTHDFHAVYDDDKLPNDFQYQETPEGMIEPIFVEDLKGRPLPDDTVVLEPRGLDQAILYITDNGRAVYGHDELIDAFMEVEGWTMEEAEDWYGVNTERSLPYITNSPYVLFNIDYMFD